MASNKIDDWEDVPAAPPIDDWEDVKEPSLGEKAKGWIENKVIDQLPELGGTAGGILGGSAGLSAGGIGAVPGAIAGAGIGGYAGKAAQNLYNSVMRPELAPKDLEETMMEPFTSGAKSATIEGLSAGAINVAGKGLQKLTPVGRYILEKLSRAAPFVDDLASSLRTKAGRLAENATGATAAQSEKFAPGAGRELLERKLVRPFDTPAKIAKRVAGASDEAAKAIDDALSSLDSHGVTASADNVVETLQNKINVIKQDPSQAGVVRKLEGIVNDIIATGKSDVGIAAAENTKRGFNKAAGNWLDPEAGVAGKEAYRAYRDEVERSALQSNPALAETFKDAKKTYGLLAPIKEATERRAAQLNQHPFGGLGDTAAAIAGGATGGPTGGLAGVIAKRTIAPRISSTSAWTVDKIANAVQATPEVFGAFARPIAEAAKRGPEALQTTLAVLGRKPEFIRTLQEAEKSLGPAVADQEQSKATRSPTGRANR